MFSSLRDLPNGTGSAAFADRQWGAEAVPGARYLIADAVQVGLAGERASTGLRGAFGAGDLLHRLRARHPGPGGGGHQPGHGARRRRRVPDGSDGRPPDPAHRGCPVADRDSDGVLDSDDQCVDVPRATAPSPARRGCPLSDRDGDGVNDADDQCADVPQGRPPRPRAARVP